MKYHKANLVNLDYNKIIPYIWVDVFWECQLIIEVHFIVKNINTLSNVGELKSQIRSECQYLREVYVNAVGLLATSSISSHLCNISNVAKTNRSKVCLYMYYYSV